MCWADPEGESESAIMMRMESHLATLGQTGSVPWETTENGGFSSLMIIVDLLNCPAL